MDSKEEVRARIWRLLEERGAALPPKPIWGRIPNFKGADLAAQRLRDTPQYASAKAVFCNPDSPQRPIREAVLRDGKVLVMATPRLSRGFLQLDPQTLPGWKLPEAATISGAFKLGAPTETSRMARVDLFVAGSVVVSSVNGVRLGKGTGYSDREHRLLREAGVISDETLKATTVHDLQVVEEALWWDSWDVPVDLIVTPTRLIEVKEKAKPVRK